MSVRYRPFSIYCLDVEWDGLTFDFTSQANTGGNSVGCGATDSTTIILFLSGTNECPGSNSFIWSGGHGSLDTIFHIEDQGAREPPSN
jgi:hypothetical protein